MRIVVDMNMSPDWVTLLNAHGHDADHWSAIGQGAAADAEIMAFARVRGAVVLTGDLDFGALLAATGEDGPSVVQVRMGDLRIEAIGAAIIRALDACAAELSAGALVVVNPERNRVRLLPFGTEP